MSLYVRQRTKLTIEELRKLEQHRWVFERMRHVDIFDKNEWKTILAQITSNQVQLKVNNNLIIL